MTTSKKPKHSSAPGRKAEDGAENVIRVNITLTPELHEIVRRNGGSVWVRQLIRDAQSKAPKA